MRDYKKLDVWQLAHALYMHIKKNVVVHFPGEERYELTSQLQRAALSVVLNIVEGCGRYTDKDFTHFLDTSLGSLNEVDYCCFAASQLNYISEKEYKTTDQMINGLRAKLISFIKFLRSGK